MPLGTSTAITSRSRGGVDICAQTWRADGSRTPTDFRQDPRTRNDVQDADESLASWTRHRIGVRQRHRRRIAGAPARFASPFGEPRPPPRSARPYVASLAFLTMADGQIGCDCLWALAL